MRSLRKPPKVSSKKPDSANTGTKERALVLNGLISGYQKGLHEPLSLSLPVGIHGIMAESGAGKTTLLKTLSGLIPPLAGSFTFMKNSLCFQEPLLLDKVKVKDNLFYALPKPVHEKEQTFLEEMVKLFELEGLEEKRADQISSGQRQRLSLAMAFLQKPDLLLLDEALSMQDQERKKRLIPRIRKLVFDHNIVCLWVSHSDREAELAFDTLFTLKKGQWIKTPLEKDGQ